MAHDDKTLLERALKIATEGIENGKGPFGAVVARNGIPLSEACNEVVISGDPTAHAEILAIRRACSVEGSHSLAGCTIYASCEPCPMCMGAIYWAGISEVVYAAGRSDAAGAGFGDDLFYEELKRDPSERTVRFRQIKGVDGKEVFRRWKRYEGKTPY